MGSAALCWDPCWGSDRDLRGLFVSDVAGRDATIIKLARVTLLAPVVVAVTLWIGGAGGGANAKSPLLRRLALPWFIVGFLGMVAANSLIEFPATVSGGALPVSKGLLLCAVTATALRSRMDLLRTLGWRAMMPVVCATLAIFAVSILVAIMLNGTVGATSR